MTQVCTLPSATPGTMESACGPLGGAGSAICAPTLKGNMPRLTAHFPALPDIAPVHPPQVGEVDGTDRQEAHCNASVYSVYSPVALPHQQNELPRVAKLFCSVPVPVQPSVADNIFSPLAPVAEVSPLHLD